MNQNQNLRYFPIALTLKGKPVLVIGGGKIAEHKVLVLLASEAKIRVVAPTATPVLRKLSRQKKIAWIAKKVAPADLLGATCVIAATNDHRLHQEIRRWTREQKILLNTVDDKPLCDFIFPAILRKEQALLGIYTDGKAPALSKALKDFLNERWNEFEEFKKKKMSGANSVIASPAAGTKQSQLLDCHVAPVGAPRNDATTKTNRGKVWLVGAGPGRWDLISVAGLTKIREADVILYDFLASRELLRFASKKATVLCVGKRKGFHSVEQKKINQTMLRFARQGKTIVRLKGGDPLLFSRGTEEALFLKSNHVPFEIIPGITSAFAAPESFGIPLTERTSHQSVAVLLGHPRKGRKPEAPACDTLIYLMAVTNIRNILKALKDSGRSAKTPCSFIENATTSDERMISGNLGNILARSRRHHVVPPAVFIVGDILRFGPKILPQKYRQHPL